VWVVEVYVPPNNTGFRTEPQVTTVFALDTPYLPDNNEPNTLGSPGGENMQQLLAGSVSISVLLLESIYFNFFFETF